MYVPGDYFRGGETNASNRRYILLQDYIHLLVHLDQRQEVYSNPDNRANSYKKLPVQDSFEEWWDSDEEKEDQSEDSDEEGENNGAHHHSDLFDGNKKRLASCHWSPNPQYQEIIKQYSKRSKRHSTKLTRPQEAPLDVLPMSSPQITDLKQRMYTYMKYHRKNINTGLAIMFEDALTYDPAVISISGYEIKAPVYGGIRSPHGRWWEYYWGFIGEEELHEMESFENTEDNNPLPMHLSFAESELQNSMLLGMPLWGPSRFDDQLLKMMYHNKPEVKGHKPLHQTYAGKFNCKESYRHLSSNKKNVNYVLYHRYVLQSLFHIAFNRRDWDTAFKLYGALTQARKSNRLNSWPMGMEILRNLNYRKWLTELDNIKPVGDTKAVNSTEANDCSNNNSVYISSNTLHYLSELKSPLLLPLILDHYIRNHSSLIQKIEKLVVSPSNLLNKIDKLFRHFSRTERGKFVLHFNGPETTFLLPHTSKRAMEDEIYNTETNNDIDNRKVNENSNKPNYEFKKPRTLKKITCFLWDYHVHYRTGNKYKLSPSVISQVNYLLINGKFDQAREVVEFGQKNKVPTAEADMLSIEINIGDILSKLSEVMIAAESSSVPFNDNVKIQSLLKSIDDLNNDILDIWASWKDQFGYIEDSKETEDSDKSSDEELDEENEENDIRIAETKVKKQRSEVGMENWGYVQEIILRLGVWIEFVKRGGKVGLGVDVFGEDWKPNDEYIDSDNELMASDDGSEIEEVGEVDFNNELNSDIGVGTDNEMEDDQFSHDDIDSINDTNSDIEETNKSNNNITKNIEDDINNEVESDEDDMGIVPDDFNEDDPEFQKEMQQLMGYDTQEQAVVAERKEIPNISESEELQSDNDSFVDEFDSDNSDYQREMARYAQYSQSQPSQSQVIQPLDAEMSEASTSSLDELSD